MDRETSAMYNAYQKRAQKADELWREVRSLYPDKDWKDAYSRAILDHVLTAEDRALLKEFHPPR